MLGWEMEEGREIFTAFALAKASSSSSFCFCSSTSPKYHQDVVPEGKDVEVRGKI